MPKLPFDPSTSSGTVPPFPCSLLPSTSSGTGVQVPQSHSPIVPQSDIPFNDLNNRSPLAQSPSPIVYLNIRDLDQIRKNSGGSHRSACTITLNKHWRFIVTLCCQQYDVIAAFQIIKRMTWPDRLQ